MASLAPALPLSSASSTASLPYHLTIRFSNSLPDLDLDIASPQTTTVLSLKKLIRERLSSRNRLRLIYQGRLLLDSSALSSSIKLPPPPSSSPPTHENSSKGKGKGKAVDNGVAPVRVYINCSIGDELSAEELAEEQAAAANPPDESSSASSSHPNGHPSSWTRPRPRGFDRLLQTGFTQSEIETLRTQFASIRTEGFAPDAMPSPDTLRNMEDEWIDSNAGGVPSANAAAEDDLNGMSNMLDVMIRGMMVGFFFPLGSLAWLLRSDVWSEKWQVFVGSGVALSLLVGVVMSITNIYY
ncbi:hypothetical protein TrVGV298_009944 [Trichoderma virens]|nr:hypothetical protein TrVGV298_009944 [Trichoderma virens]